MLGYKIGTHQSGYDVLHSTYPNLKTNVAKFGNNFGIGFSSKKIQVPPLGVQAFRLMICWYYLVISATLRYSIAFYSLTLVYCFLLLANCLLLPITIGIAYCPLPIASFFLPLASCYLTCPTQRADLQGFAKHMAMRKPRRTFLNSCPLLLWLSPSRFRGSFTQTVVTVCPSAMGSFSHLPPPPEPPPSPSPCFKSSLRLPLRFF